MSITEWSSDACPCIVWKKYPENILYRIVQKCHMHKDVSDAELLTSMRTQTASWKNTNQRTARKTEYDRIAALGDPVVENRDI